MPRSPSGASGALLSLLFACSAHEGALRAGKPAAASVVEQGDATLAARVARIMEPYDRSDRPGCAVSVVQQGRVTHARGYGMADLEHAVPIGPDTVFDIASNGKQFFAMAILLLQREQKLNLDDRIQKYVPELPDYGTPITLRHLLTHTSGLRDYTWLLSLAGYGLHDTIQKADALAIIVRQNQLQFPPGQRFSYSNSGYFLLGLVIERTSGLSLAQFLERRILTPLAMKHSRLNDDPAAVVPGRAIGYAWKPSGFRTDVSPWPAYGDGGVLTTVLDLARWDANFYEPKVGDQQLLTQLQERGKLSDGSEHDYAAGLVIGEHRSRPTVRHGGGWPGFRSQIVRFPQQRTSVIVLCNASDADAAALALEISDSVLEPQSVEAAPAVAPALPASVPELQRSTGTYRYEDGDRIRVIFDGRSLVLRRSSGTPYALQKVGERRFALEALPQFVFEFEGRYPDRKLKDPRNSIWLDDKPYTGPGQPLSTFAGTYTCEELGVSWTVRVSAGALMLQGRHVAGPLERLDADSFVSETVAGTLDFEADAGKISGFALRGDEPRLRFVRTHGP